MMCGHHELLHHARLLEVAVASGPIGIEALPLFEDIGFCGSTQIEIYRRLGGEAADQRLREHLRRAFAEMRDERGHFPWHWPCFPEILDEDLRGEMTHWASAAPLSTVLDLHRSAPWLAGEPMVQAAAQRHLEHRPPTPELAMAAAQVLSTRTVWEKDGTVLPAGDRTLERLECARIDLVDARREDGAGEAPDGRPPRVPADAGGRCEDHPDTSFSALSFPIWPL
jgi:hypothetical protein